MKRFTSLGVLAVALSLTTLPALSQEVSPVINGKKNLVCASQEVVACVDGAVCLQGSPHTLDVPAFMFVDPKKKQIRGVDEDGSEVTSPVKQADVTAQSYILQGFEDHQGWTVGIDRLDGSFTLSMTGPVVNVMVMGFCTEL